MQIVRLAQVISIFGLKGGVIYLLMDSIYGGYMDHAKPWTPYGGLPVFVWRFHKIAL
jgi:hypothetical protein